MERESLVKIGQEKRKQEQGEEFTEEEKTRFKTTLMGGICVHAITR